MFAFANSTSLAARARKAAQIGLLSGAVVLFAGAGDPAARFKDLGHRLMCICGCNQILLECNHVGCPDSDNMRNELMAGVQRGDSDSLVEQAFVQKYGPIVLAAPPTTGFINQSAWIIPFVVLVAGLSAVTLLIRGWKGGPPSGPTAGGTSNQSRLDEFREQARRETEL